MLAVSTGNVAIVEALLAAGASPDAANNNGATALTLARKKRNKVIASMLRSALISQVTEVRKKDVMNDPQNDDTLQILQQDLDEVEKKQFLKPFEQDGDTNQILRTIMPRRHLFHLKNLRLLQVEEPLRCLECGSAILPEDILCPRCRSTIVRRYCAYCSQLIPAHVKICPAVPE